MKIKSGIYKILNLVTFEFYVGSAFDLCRREKVHYRTLKNNIHPNIHLQHSFNKHGIENFQFIILEYVEDKTKLIEREQHYIDTLNPKYNIVKIVDKPMQDRNHTQDSKDKISLNNGRGMLNRKHTPEELIRMSESHIGIPSSRKGTVQPQTIKSRISATLKQYYLTHTNPTKGSKRIQRREDCIECGGNFAIGIINRHHNEKCKFKK